ncbi:glycosyltransferase family 4 protein [soil metagenome]
MAERDAATLKTLAFIGNYLPRQCGIATFTTHLCEAVAGAFPQLQLMALPMNDSEAGYAYPEPVRFEVQQNELASYRSAADFLNINNVDLVCLQHEYGIFGGSAGSHVLALLRELRTPIVTTLHTVLDRPNPSQHRVMLELGALSDRLVVMSERGRQYLETVYGFAADKIDLIPHGIPDMPFIDPSFYKDQFGVEGKLVLLTFGLLSAAKGIEEVIKALPRITERYPNLIYLVLGATHPHVKRAEGELYLLGLQRLAAALGVEAHVSFYNRFVSEAELLEFIAAADLYITPYLNREQIVSGTLAYAAGAGKAVISTPYWYAEEFLADGRGRLVPFRDAPAIAAAVLELLDNETERHAMRKRAYLAGREMIWSQVARRYLESFVRAKEARAAAPRRVSATKTLGERAGELPLLKLDHLHRMTDGTGLLQHAKFAVPNYAEGYTTYDNARALVLSVYAWSLGPDDAREAYDLATRYLAFLNHAFEPASGRFRNVMNFERRWLELVGSDDSHGRALWGLGTVLGRLADDGLRGLAATLFDRALPAVLKVTSPRAWAFALLGMHGYLRAFPGDSAAKHACEMLAGHLLTAYRRCAGEDWRWFEDILAYSNAKLPHALILAGRQLGDKEMLALGLETLRWLVAVQRDEAGHFVPVGSNGFYPRGEVRARFDQQPVEAHATISACLEAYRATNERVWLDEARRAFDWFLGRNDLGLPLYDPLTGGCRDGLHPDRVNQNQGAEASLSFLLSLAELRMAEHVIDALSDALPEASPAVGERPDAA